MKLFDKRWLSQLLGINLFFFGVFIGLPRSSYADESYKTDYVADYHLEQNGSSKVRLTIKITNLRSDIHVEEFAMAFPENFEIHDIKASDAVGEVSTKKEIKDSMQNVTLRFNQPQTGKNSENTFNLEFTQDKLFTILGNVWEVVLPVISDPQTAHYSIALTVPGVKDRNIVSLVKPNPTRVEGNKIYWDNVATKTVYIVFGTSQFFSFNLNYTLKNDRFIQREFDIATPPETAYQKIYITNVQPRPILAYIDDDGNYLLRYTVSGNREEKVSVNGFVQTFADPNSNFSKNSLDLTTDEKKMLLSESEFWTLGSYEQNSEIKKLKTARDIYDFVVSTLSYSYDRVNTTTKRLGAARALKSPKSALCMEFTDLFIALSREKGIPAREVQGFAYSQDPRLRPLSLVSDILHSWPEYWDKTDRRWHPVDPTWENTSGIDYFNSFDLNHIAFAIHGSNPTYPLPAGMYKTTDSKDVSVEVTDTLPKEDTSVEIENDFNPKIVSENQYSGKVTITNRGNVFIKGAKVKFESKNVIFKPQEFAIDNLAPFQNKTYKVIYQAKGSSDIDSIKIIYNGKDRLSQKINIISRLREIFILVLMLIIVVMVLVVIFITTFSKKVKT